MSPGGSGRHRRPRRSSSDRACDGACGVPQDAKIAYTPKDAYSATVKVGATVTNAAGTVVASLNLGWVKQGAAQVCAWKPRRRGSFTVTFKAVDLGGNHLAAPVVTTVKVR